MNNHKQHSPLSQHLVHWAGLPLSVKEVLDFDTGSFAPWVVHEVTFRHFGYGLKRYLHNNSNHAMFMSTFADLQLNFHFCYIVTLLWVCSPTPVDQSYCIKLIARVFFFCFFFLFCFFLIFNQEYDPFPTWRLLFVRSNSHFQYSKKLLLKTKYQTNITYPAVGTGWYYIVQMLSAL